MELGRLECLATVETEFLKVCTQLLPAECVCWNTWTHNMDTVLSSRANFGYEDELGRLIEPLNAVVMHHPLIVCGRFWENTIRPQRLTDYQGSGAFRHNPLYREVYRFLDAKYQLSYTAGESDGRIVCLTWNRWFRDFDERERDMLHLIGLRLREILHCLDAKARMERICGALGSWVASGNSLLLPERLSLSEARLLSGLIGGEQREKVAADLGWRRDTLDRRLAKLRDRFGVASGSQLVADLARLGPRLRK